MAEQQQAWTNLQTSPIITGREALPLRNLASHSTENGDRVQRLLLPVALCHKAGEGSLWQPRYSKPQTQAALTFSMMSSRLLKWWVWQPSARSTSNWVASFRT